MPRSAEALRFIKLLAHIDENVFEFKARAISYRGLQPASQPGSSSGRSTKCKVYSHRRTASALAKVQVEFPTYSDLHTAVDTVQFSDMVD